MTDELFIKLENYNKQKLLDILKDLLDKKLITKENLEIYVKNKNLSDEEQKIVDALNAETELNAKQKSMIHDLLESKKHIKISSALNSTNKFLQAVVDYKIKRYFEITWNVYPRKVGKQLGIKAYKNLLKDKTIEILDKCCQYILARVKYYQSYCTENNLDEQYILHFSTFCNSRKYLG